MAIVAVVASRPSYFVTLGAVIDAHARLGEAFNQNPALSDYARMQTELVLASADGGPAIELVGGRSLPADTDLASITAPRIVFLPSFQLASPDHPLAGAWRSEALNAWLRSQANAGVQIGACGAGVFHLAAAGLLDGHAAAISPRLADAMREGFPAVRINAAGPIHREGNLWTCARDIDSGALAASLFAETFSMSVGRAIASRESPGPAAAILLEQADPVVARAQMWIRDRFTQRFRISDLARALGITHQSLIRRFYSTGSVSPRHFVQRVRIDAAASMLVETKRSVAEIAQLVGYADAASFRRVFVETMKTTPSAYRRKMADDRGANQETAWHIPEARRT